MSGVLNKGLRRVGLAVLLCAAFISSGSARAAAFDTSLGSLICSVEGKAPPDQDALGPVYIVACSFHEENGGAVASYVGTLLLQPQAQETARSYIWIVRGPRSLALAPDDLSHTYTSGGTVTPGTMAPLIPKDGEDLALGLFTLSDPIPRKPDHMRKHDPRQPRSDPVATLDIKLVEAPA